jgi:hypothetical protein
MKKALTIGSAFVATMLLSTSMSVAQAPPPGRADQSGGGAAEMKANKPAAAGPMDGTVSPSGGNRLADQPSSRTTPVTPKEERKGGANAK